MLQPKEHSVDLVCLVMLYKDRVGGGEGEWRVRGEGEGTSIPSMLPSQYHMKQDMGVRLRYY